MQTEKANEILEKLATGIEKKGIQTDVLIPELQKVREFALQENDPLLARSLRVLWQHLENNEGFALAYLEDVESPEENLQHLINLYIKSGNTYNRDEIREMTNLMQAMI